MLLVHTFRITVLDDGFKITFSKFHKVLFYFIKLQYDTVY